MPKTLYWRIFPDLLAIVVHTSEPPTDEDYDAFCEELVTAVKQDGIKGMLIYSEEAGPSAAQRSRSSAMLKEAGAADLKIAIMSGSRLVRGMVTAFSWAMAGNVHAFSTRDFDKALDSFGIPDGERVKIRVGLKQLALTSGTRVEAFADESGKFRQKYGD